MASYNKVILMGHLTRDPEAKALPSGTPLTEFSLAVNRQWKDANGEKREEVLFIDCSSFGKPAEALAKYLKKGKPIHIEGHLKLDMWEDQDGNKRSKVRVIVEQFRFVDSGRNEQAVKDNGGKQGHTSGKSKNGKRSSGGRPRPQPVPVGAGEEEAGGGEAAPASGNSVNEADIPF